MNVFDILGPVMIGPSSSHTAGAARIGRLAGIVLGEPPVKADFYLHGSFAETYLGHGTDRALVGGLLGFDTADERIRQSLELAEEAKIKLAFHKTDLGEVHPNTVKVVVRGQSGKVVPETVAGDSHRSGSGTGARPGGAMAGDATQAAGDAGIAG